MEAIFPQHELCCILRAIPLDHISFFPLKSSILKTSFYVLLGEVHCKRQRNPYSVGDQHVIDSRQKKCPLSTVSYHCPLMLCIEHTGHKRWQQPNVGTKTRPCGGSMLARCGCLSARPVAAWLAHRGHWPPTCSPPAPACPLCLGVAVAACSSSGRLCTCSCNGSMVGTVEM